MGWNMSDPTATTATAEPPKGGAVAAIEPGRAVESLQKQVREKDQLVAALTERLEQAAEQLDRLRRTGADKGHRPLAGGTVPLELVQDQKQTLEQLKKFTDNWEEIQPGAALQRIESQVTEIRNLISAGVTIGSAGAAPATPARDRPSASPAPAAARSAPAEGKSSSTSSWWEKQKAAMLGEGPEPTEETATAAASSAAGSQPSGDESDTNESTSSFALGDTVIPDLPAPVNFDDLTLDDAKQAIRERDQVLQQLREPLLLLKAAGQLPQDLQSLEQLPAALRQRVEELESQWQAKFRQAELELSLERARLAREQSQTRQQQEMLTKQIKQSGSAQREQDEVGDAADEGGSRRRWFRFMGRTEGAKEPSDGEPK